MPGDGGLLKYCNSQTDARRTAINWAIKQLRKRVYDFGPPLNLKTDKERYALFDEWSRSECEIDDNHWEYTIKKDTEALIVRARKVPQDECPPPTTESDGKAQELNNDA